MDVHELGGCHVGIFFIKTEATERVIRLSATLYDLWEYVFPGNELGHEGQRVIWPL